MAGGTATARHAVSVWQSETRLLHIVTPLAASRALSIHSGPKARCGLGLWNHRA